MEKYLIILVIIFVLYYAYSCWTSNKVEGFADAQTINGVDESNAIQTLATIAKDILEGGGLKVAGNIYTEGDFSHIGPSKKNKVSLHTPADGRRALYIAPQKIDGTNWEWENGLALDFNAKTFSTNSNNLNVGGDLITNGALPRLGPAKNKFTLHTPDDDRKGLWIAPSKDDANTDWNWGNALNLKRDGNHYLGGNLQVTGAIRTGNNRGMRFFTMQVGDNTITLLKDGNMAEFPAAEWVCMCVGTRMDWGNNSPGAMINVCFSKDGKWWLRSEVENAGDYNYATILAIHRNFFESVQDPPNSGVNHLGNW